ncbi:MAG: hypothetical protein Q9221_002082 [Calogaya cf. arnoldii]
MPSVNRAYMLMLTFIFITIHLVVGSAIPKENLDTMTTPSIAATPAAAQTSNPTMTVEVAAVTPVVTTMVTEIRRRTFLTVMTSATANDSSNVTATSRSPISSIAEAIHLFTYSNTLPPSPPTPPFSIAEAIQFVKDILPYGNPFYSPDAIINGDRSEYDGAKSSSASSKTVICGKIFQWISILVFIRIGLDIVEGIESQEQSRLRIGLYGNVGGNNSNFVYVE